MQLKSREFLTACAVLFASGNAAAQWRCDCTSIVGSCQATATVQESFIEVTTDVEQCARVEYLVDGIPFVALVVDGAERQDWIAQSATPEVIVEGCQVCLDNAGEAAAREFGAGLYSDGEPTRLIGVEPAYPAEAAAAGIEGYVDVRFVVSPTGTVADPEVVAAEPPGVFDAAALAAVLRWRYTRPPEGSQQGIEVTERVEFDLDEAILALSAAPGETRRPIAAREPARNRCIREENRYDFGASIDISLINACSEPLYVFSCAEGTGPVRDRWVCRDPDAGAAAGGAGAGALAPGAGNRFEITRAPNSEHWWLACAVDDTACREAGREWVRSLNRQTASIDPQARTRAALARSY